MGAPKGVPGGPHNPHPLGQCLPLPALLLESWFQSIIYCRTGTGQCFWDQATVVLPVLLPHCSRWWSQTPCYKLFFREARVSKNQVKTMQSSLWAPESCWQSSMWIWTQALTLWHLQVGPCPGPCFHYSLGRHPELESLNHTTSDS
jgi:hypothetical protein